MIAKLEWTQSNTQQNIEQIQNPTMGETINNETTTTTEPPPKNGQQPKTLGWGGGGQMHFTGMKSSPPAKCILSRNLSKTVVTLEPIIKFDLC